MKTKTPSPGWLNRIETATTRYCGRDWRERAILLWTDYEELLWRCQHETDIDLELKNAKLEQEKETLRVELLELRQKATWLANAASAVFGEATKGHGITESTLKWLETELSRMPSDDPCGPDAEPPPTPSRRS